MSKWRAGQASGPGDDDVGLLATGADEGVEHGLHEAGVLGDDPCGKRGRAGIGLFICYLAHGNTQASTNT